MGFSENLIREFFSDCNSDVVLATKGSIRTESETGRRWIDNSPDYLRAALESSLSRLGRDWVDIYYIHRKEPDREIEETIETLADFKREGKIRFLGLSEVSADTLRRAHAVHPISVLQSENSLWTREPEDDVLQTCKELDITFVAFSPLARGMLTTSGVDPQKLLPKDFRRLNPRFRWEQLPAQRRCN